MTDRKRAGGLIVLAITLLIVGIGAVQLAPGASSLFFDAPTAEGGAVEEVTLTVAGEVDFAFSIQNVEACGLVCRNVTAEVRNTGTADASNVTIAVTIRANGSAVWSNQREIGTLASGRSYRTTERVTVSPGEAQEIQTNDGEVIIEVVIRHDDGTSRLERERSVL